MSRIAWTITFALGLAAASPSTVSAEQAQPAGNVEETISKYALSGRITTADGTVATRSHSLSLYVDSASFPRLSPGSYVVQFSAQFNTFRPGSTAPDATAEVRMLFDELVKVERDGSYKFVPTARRVLENLPLSDKNGITLKISLVPLDPARQDIVVKYLRPLMGTVLESRPVLGFLDSFLAPSTGQQATTVFEASFAVPLNVIEYRTLEERRQPLLRTDVPVVLLAAGTYQVQDESLLGRAAGAIGGIIHFVSGRQVLTSLKDVEYGGALHIHFTRSENPVLPPDLLASLRAVDNEVAASSVSDNQQSVDAALARLASLAQANLANGTITQGSYHNVLSFAQFAKAYMWYQRRYQGWELHFRNALSDASSIGRTYGTQIVPVGDIYRGAIADIAVLYSLPDDQLVRVVNWQTAMHEGLAAEGDPALARTTAATGAR